MKHKILILAYFLQMTVSYANDTVDFPLNTIHDVEYAIKSGALGKEIADRAIKTENIYLTEIKKTGIPYKVYTFADYAAGYTVMVENNKLVLLGNGWGGGYAQDFKIRKIDGKSVLLYRYFIGSGISSEINCSYILGSGMPGCDMPGFKL